MSNYLLSTYSRINLSFTHGKGAWLFTNDKKKYNIFGEGAVKNTAKEFNKEFLGEIPIDPKVGTSGDKGKPIVEEDSNDQISKIYINFANKIKSIYL